jgi:hypothetical protein
MPRHCPFVVQLARRDLDDVVLHKPLEDITEEELRQYWLACTSDFG